MATGFSAAELRRMLAAQEAKEAREAAEVEARRNAGPKELVAASPSPRKKRARVDDFPSSRSDGGRVPQPDFFGKPQLDRKLSGHDGKVELLSRPKESQFASHESALPRGLAERIADEKAAAAAKEKRERERQERSRGFGDLTKDSRNVLLEGKTGRVALFDKKPKEEKVKREGSSKGKERTKEPTADEGDDLLRKAAASGSSGAGIGRPANKPFASSPTSASAYVKEEKPLARRRDDAPKKEEDDLDIVGGPKKRSRNKDGTVIEEVEMGPRVFEPAKDDPNWEKVEPYSGIKLRKRLLPHATVDDLMDGRYHLTPSQIYSLARIDSRQRIDLDPDAVDSDWVVIGVLAQKGEVRFLNSNPYGGKGAGPPKEGKDDEDEDDEDDEEAAGGKKKGKGKGRSSAGGGSDSIFAAPSRKKRAQKYLRFDLVDFSSSRASSSGHGKLNVMLVEADSVDKSVDDDGNEQSVYKGQSGGAYEKFWKESPGAVVAILNPTFLSYSNKFPTYTIKPTSADSMVVIGRADHLAFCDAITKEGKPCGSWVDNRAGKFCDYHVNRALQRTGNSRPETYANTASLSKQGSINLSKLQKSFAPGGSSKAVKVPNGVSISGGGGLAKPKPTPLSRPAGVVVGDSTVHVTAGTRSSMMTMRASNVLPNSLTTAPGSRGGGSFIAGVREGPSVSEEKKKRLRQAEADKRARKEYRELMRSDKGRSNGGELLRLAGEAMGKGKKRGSSDGEEEDGDEDERKEKKSRRSVLSGQVARSLGFDPTKKGGEVERDQSKEAKEFRSLLENGLDPASHKFDLSAPPGAKIRSVGAPVDKKPDLAALQSEGDDDDDDLVISLAKLKKT
ncbi:hypothetical protein JCM10213v2_007975 [Rhodosporidiobolus nylandii]